MRDCLGVSSQTPTRILVVVVTALSKKLLVWIVLLEHIQNHLLLDISHSTVAMIGGLS